MEVSGFDESMALPAGTLVGGAVLARPITRMGDLVIYDAQHSRWGPVWVHEFWPSRRVRRTATGPLEPALPAWAAHFNQGLAAFGKKATLWVTLPGRPSRARGLAAPVESGTPYLITKRPGGQPLAAALGDPNLRSAEAVEGIADQLAEALSPLHAAGLGHGDLSPETVFVDDEGQACVAGPGSPSLENQSRGYSAPERDDFPQAAATEAGDVYGLSAILFRLITGIAPLDARQRLYRGHDETAAARAPEGFSPEFLALIDAGLDLDPDHRPKAIGLSGNSRSRIRTRKKPALVAEPPPEAPRAAATSATILLPALAMAPAVTEAATAPLVPHPVPEPPPFLPEPHIAATPVVEAPEAPAPEPPEAVSEPPDPLAFPGVAPGGGAPRRRWPAGVAAAGLLVMLLSLMAYWQLRRTPEPPVVPTGPQATAPPAKPRVVAELHPHATAARRSSVGSGASAFPSTSASASNSAPGAAAATAGRPGGVVAAQDRAADAGPSSARAKPETTTVVTRTRVSHGNVVAAAVRVRARATVQPRSETRKRTVALARPAAPSPPVCTQVVHQRCDTVSAQETRSVITDSSILTLPYRYKAQSSPHIDDALRQNWASGNCRARGGSLHGAAQVVFNRCERAACYAEVSFSCEKRELITQLVQRPGPCHDQIETACKPDRTGRAGRGR